MKLRLYVPDSMSRGVKRVAGFTPKLTHLAFEKLEERDLLTVMWGEQAKLTAPDAAAGDQFGFNVSVDGNTAVVGAATDDDAGTNSGAAYVYIRDDNGTPTDPNDDSWAQQTKLTANDAAGGDLFGVSTSISGDTIVVGAHSNDDGGANSGSAYIFRRDNNGTPSDLSDDSWSQQAKLTANDASGGDLFGASVAVNESAVVVGALLNNDAGPESGSAYVFVRDDNGTPLDSNDDSWAQQAKLTAADAAAGNRFGQSVGVSSGTAVVGDGNAANAGAAYVFVRDDNGTPEDLSDDSWAQQAKLVAGDAAAGDRLGITVSISGDTVVAGADLDDNANGVNAGAAYVFQRTGTTWTEQAKIVASDGAAGDFFGTVSLDDDSLVVGARSDSNASTAGAAYVFARSGSTWTEQAKLTASDAAPGDDFGGWVDISQQTVIAGAISDDDAGSSSGSAYIFVGQTPIVSVEIDIKPGSNPNSINLGSNGNVPVAILSSETFDATTLDPKTITLADAGVKVRGNGKPQASEQDVNGDGRTDLVVHVETQGLQLTEGDETATLRGQTSGGDEVEGTDSVRIVAALHAASGGGSERGALDLDAVRSLTADISNVQFIISDLPHLVLAQAERLADGSGRVTLDHNASGVGWFVDSTPWQRNEFPRSRGGAWTATPGSDAFGRYDLVTVIHHEIEHLLGSGHDGAGLMAPVLQVGVRHQEDDSHSGPLAILPRWDWRFDQTIRDDREDAYAESRDSADWEQCVDTVIESGTQDLALMPWGDTSDLRENNEDSDPGAGEYSELIPGELSKLSEV